MIYRLFRVARSASRPAGGARANARPLQRVLAVGIIALALIAGSAGALMPRSGAEAASREQDEGVYIVQPGDNLTRIAARLGVSPTALAQANGIWNWDYIYVGQRLVVPGGYSASAPGPATHVVQRGETLASIAARYGVSIADLVQANGLRNQNFIWVGQRLTIPGGSQAEPTVEPTPAWSVLPLPPAPTPVPAPAATAVPILPTPTAVPTALPTPAPQPTAAQTAETYVVQVGDSLAKIAQRYGTTVAALVAANNLPNPNFIWVGQRLKVTQGGSALPNPAPQPAPAPTAGRWIDVNLSQQRLTAYQGQTPVFTALISSGVPAHPTVVGTFAIQTKLVSTTMSGPGYWLPNVPYTMYFYAGYAIHGTYWHNNFGHPMSHGCVNVSTPNAAWLFGWASVGTPVVIHY